MPVEHGALGRNKSQACWYAGLASHKHNLLMLFSMPVKLSAAVQLYVRGR